MKYRLLLSVFLFSFASYLWADSVDRQQAEALAREFLNQKGASGTLIAAATPMQKARAKGMKSPDYYHIFNIGDQEGFVIVSGDDRTAPVLGYSDKGRFDADQLPDNIKAWLDGYAEQISSLSSNGIPVRALPSHKKIQPLIKAEWGQNEPYNNDCPSGCVTGCVATAMGQIMYHYKWPERTTKEIPAYTTETNEYPMEAQPLTTFDWKKMQDKYSGEDTGPKVDAVSSLMLCIGKAVQMDYDASSSGAITSMIAFALKEYFDYSPNVREVQRRHYTIADWDALIYNEIAEGRPVLYGGQSSVGGHQFICDGYAGDGLYHINWGWDGWLNGDFLLSVVNPNGSGTGGTVGYDGYSMEQSAVIGLDRNKGQAPVSGEKNLTVEILTSYGGDEYTRNSRYSDFKNFGFTYSLANHTTESFDNKFAFALFQNGKMVSDFLGNTYWDNGIIVPGAYYPTSYIQGFSFGRGLVGTYQLYPICQIDNSGEWIPVWGTNERYLELVITDTKMTVITHEPKISLEAYGHYFTKDRQIWREVAELNVGIRNKGTEFNGNLYLLVNGNYCSGIGYQLEEGEESFAQFHYVPQSVNEQLEVRMDNPRTGEIIYQSSAMGDANGDLLVDMKDIVCIMDYLKGKNPAGFKEVSADMNGDGIINIADIIMLINSNQKKF